MVKSKPGTVPLSFEARVGASYITATEAIWDSSIYGRPIAQISTLQLSSEAESDEILQQFRRWRDGGPLFMISCRLSSERLRELMSLEDLGFRFVESVLHPRFDEIALKRFHDERGLEVKAATEADLAIIGDVAQSAFVNERFYKDPRLDKSLSGRRYSKWACSALQHPKQKLVKICENGEFVAFFVYEETGANVYWHLTAVDPRLHGKGYGRRVWEAMLRFHANAGVKQVSTTIAAGNVAVLNLYSSLNAKFNNPSTTLHWIRAES